MERGRNRTRGLTSSKKQMRRRRLRAWKGGRRGPMEHAEKRSRAGVNLKKKPEKTVKT